MGNIERSDAEIDVLSDLLDRARAERDSARGLLAHASGEVESLRQQLEGAVDQARSLIDALERDLNDVGPWGSGYRQALADVREQLRLRFGGQ